MSWKRFRNMQEKLENVAYRIKISENRREAPTWGTPMRRKIVANYFLVFGCFQLLDLIIKELKSHMTC